ncbi:TVP38/TMEM64 family protein [Neorhodopirellula pilleata]|uniref:TVP38/TMEM64 family membrane protein n=1 Tax=Neorhodopirellula pilleata TaxID=2714738 RepID=A0A5C6AZI7_9BACT|nr:TVP38/TMEM64 family protein [Neorhodopirellula pilleata]TWU03534.1 TVP38/TMEM64 family inner membrane protein YdjZ [Neorhodopirellula pilleata]
MVIDPDFPHSDESAKLSQEGDSPQKHGNALKIGLLAMLAVAALGGYWLIGDRLSLEYLATQESALREYRQSYPFLAAFVAIAVYVAVAGFSLPGAVVLTLACGWYFGFWQGLLVVSFGSTGGATMAFLMTRYILQDWVQRKFAKRLESVNDVFDREGAFYLFTLRLIPAVPFFVINAVMGLTKISAITFWWVSQIGMLPGTAAYVYAGSTVPSLTQLAQEGVGTVISWQLFLAFAILGLLPLVIKRVMAAARSFTLQND